MPGWRALASLVLDLSANRYPATPDGVVSVTATVALQQAGDVRPLGLTHYRRMIDTAIGLGPTPVVTLQHFSVPKWFADEGSWMIERAVKAAGGGC
ncbi:family 1 glycosylhydrolase [Streptomyces sp. MBT65]|uniref:family 1 glycosylhydrolase n=1 Tax=Streptomyces sp. MBT65 TaxID=1488395 RepID=UPI0027DA360D|nr:family 1 glycosylhydrolase [Streptomyces sp. MBT65]